MKNVSLILASVAIMIFASCKGETEKTTETVVIEKQVEAAPEKEAEDGTSVSIDKDGVDFSTKDGTKKTEIEIKK